MNDQIIVTIPDWFIYFIAIWFTLQIIVNFLTAYQSHLERKLKKVDLQLDKIFKGSNNPCRGCDDKNNNCYIKCQTLHSYIARAS